MRRVQAVLALQQAAERRACEAEARLAVATEDAEAQARAARTSESLLQQERLVWQGRMAAMQERVQKLTKIVYGLWFYRHRI